MGSGVLVTGLDGKLDALSISAEKSGIYRTNIESVGLEQELNLPSS